MPQKPGEERTYALPGGCLLFLLGAAAVVVLVSALHWIGALLVLVVGTASVAAGVWYRGWFPYRATAELNKLIKPLGQARLLRTRCKRDGNRWEVYWKVPTGVHVAGLKKMVGVFEVALDCSCDFENARGRGVILMRAGTAVVPNLLAFEEFYSEPAPREGELMLGIGWGRIGRVWVDLTEIPHMLVGGTPGSGKSVFLRQVLVWLMLTYEASKLRVVLIDLKGGMEFYPFRALPHLWAPVVSDTPELGPTLDKLLAELDRRMAMFREAGVVSLRQWNAEGLADSLPYIVVIVDEFGELNRPVAESPTDSGRGRSPKAQAHAAISRVARLGRAVGIHLLACTQRPDAEVMPGQIKDQLPATVACRTRSETNSHILLGDKDPAAALLPAIKGRAVFQWETNDEVQVPFIEPTVAVALLWEKYAQPVGHVRVTQCPTSPQEIEREDAA